MSRASEGTIFSANIVTVGRFWWRLGVVGNDVGQVNEVALATPAPVIPGMGGLIRVQILVRKIHLGLTNHPGQLSLAILSWVGAMSTGQKAVMLCDWGVKAGMACVWWQVKLHV